MGPSLLPLMLLGGLLVAMGLPPKEAALNTYEVVWVNLYTGKLAKGRIRAASHGTADLLRAIEKKHSLIRGAAQVMEARQV